MEILILCKDCMHHAGAARVAPVARPDFGRRHGELDSSTHFRFPTEVNSGSPRLKSDIAPRNVSCRELFDLQGRTNRVSTGTVSLRPGVGGPSALLIHRGSIESDPCGIVSREERPAMVRRLFGNTIAQGGSRDDEMACRAGPRGPSV